MKPLLTPVAIAIMIHDGLDIGYRNLKIKSGMQVKLRDKGRD